MKISIIGVGRLGSVFAKALARDHEVILIDRDPKRAHEVADAIGAEISKDVQAANETELAIIAVKPAHLEEVVRQISPPILVSCAAGIPIKKLESWGAKNVIRVMPNVCAEVREAVIAYSMHAETEKKEKAFLTAFSALGLCVKTDEAHLDPMTAASGSGPAFVAFLAGAMIEEAVAQGLDKNLAERAVAQTLVGTGKMMLSGDWPASRIIETVASPGGTTEAGLNMLKAKNVNKSIHEAIRFATEKARELGK